MTDVRSGLALLALAAGLGAARPAQACGGFFCNPMAPVLQIGENVAFAVSKDPDTGKSRVEVHVQILYTGPADKFSWVVPVDTEPTLAAGAATLFQVVEPMTRPRFSVPNVVEGTCKDGAGGASGGASGGSSDGGGGGSGAVVVTFRGDVGPFDATVIKSGDAMALKTWLTDNGYEVPTVAGPIIDAYVAEAKYFVALKLQRDKSVQEIRPIVLRFDGDTPCVPLRLTAIAATTDLRINLFVLGDARAVPANFLEFTLNPARIDWLRNGVDYDALVKEAAHAAGGNAFIVEYAGPPAGIGAALWTPMKFNLAYVRAAANPAEAWEAAQYQPFPRDGVLLGILRKHIPLPDALAKMGVTEGLLWGSLRMYWDKFAADFAPFDAKAFATDLDAEIVRPLRAAQETFDRHPYLTRLATFISPDEMKKDPIFKFNKSLPDVPTTYTATLTRMCGEGATTVCGANLRVAVTAGPTILLRPRSPTSCFSHERADLDALPAFDVAWKRGTVGPGEPTIDNRDHIAKVIAEHNADVAAGLPAREPGPEAVDAGAPSDAPPPLPEPRDAAAEARGPGVGSGHAGCGCTVGEGGGPSDGSAWWVAVGLLIGLAGRRRWSTCFSARSVRAGWTSWAP